MSISHQTAFPLSLAVSYDDIICSQVVLKSSVKLATNVNAPPKSLRPSMYVLYSVSFKVVVSSVDGSGLISGISLISGTSVYPVVGFVPFVVSTAYFKVIPAVLNLILILITSYI